nr:MAG TPA: tail protein [Caudoviricetes sp.]
MTYQRRELTVEFTLAEGSFDSQNGNVLTAKNMKCECSISAYGGITGTSLNMSMYGLSLDKMAKMTNKAQRYISQKQNLVKVVANDETIFVGTITSSRINLNQMPDAPIEIVANATGYERTQPCAPTSVKGTTPVASMVKAIANKAGLKFVNIDVDAQATNEYAKGNAIQQIEYLAHAYGFSHEIDVGTVTIFKGENAIDAIVPYVSPQTGLIGYPIFYDVGINFRTMFSSALKIGRKVQLQTSLPNGSGEYLITNGTTHYLSSNMDGGLWDTFVVAYPLENIGAN